MLKSDYKKILILANDSGGLYKFRVELIERLIKEGYNVYIASPYSSFVNNFIDLGCSYIEVNINRRGKNLFQDLKLFARYVKIITKVKPQVVLTYTIKPNIYGSLACSLTKVPCIANVTGLGTALENGGLLKNIIISLYKIAFAKIKRVFVQNKDIKRFLIYNNIVAEVKLRLIPGSGVNLERFYFTKYPAMSDVIDFYFVGRIMKDKGIDEYLEAAKLIIDKYPKTVFHVCGECESDYQGRFKEYCDNKIINYHGGVKDMHEVYEKSHCIILPTYHEGMSNVLQEAASMGRPVLASNIIGCKEIFDEGQSGFGFEPRNTQSLVNAIEKFIYLPYEKKREMGLHGRKKMESEFNRQIVVNAYINEIEKIIKGN